MRSTEIVMVEKEVTTWKCDFCDYQTEHNRGCCGSAPVMKCHFCEKDACRKHREAYWEKPWEDYPDFLACQECKPKVDKAVHVAQQIAGRYDAWVDVVDKVFDDLEDYAIYLEDYEPPKPHEPIDISELYES